jgi:hypothetical protein
MRTNIMLNTRELDFVYMNLCAHGVKDAAQDEVPNSCFFGHIDDRGG